MGSYRKLNIFKGNIVKIEGIQGDSNDVKRYSNVIYGQINMNFHGKVVRFKN